ncbi:MAG: Stp1/IreP family PP2C-type Ser/Thr phosphatase [Gallionella sp.]|jgi:protein phosphatase|nr:Stp1/IreP family PP2C-type Ser/Thr phosphatase [Gallionella sp.]MCK9354863.1 Stp1/IreP family PP2C-type Ser/Thr phosphatase [Gallionella sp.]
MRIDEALEIISLTNPGMVRSHNEDSVACDAACGLAVLADGMGGYNAGEVASGIAVSVVATEICQRLQEASPIERDEESGDELGVALLRDNIRKANISIYQAAQSQPQYSGMGTTIVAGLFYDNSVVVGHVGDSRMYRLRDGVLETITRDHSLLQEQIDSGMISIEDARLSKNKNLVTRAVGIDADVVPEIHVHDVQLGDIYLLCSDGLNDMMEDEDIQSTLYAMQGNLPLAAEQLIQQANDNGGRDNVSVILVKVKGEFAASRGWLAKLLNWFGK